MVSFVGCSASVCQAAGLYLLVYVKKGAVRFHTCSAIKFARIANNNNTTVEYWCRVGCFKHYVLTYLNRYILLCIKLVTNEWPSCCTSLVLTTPHEFHFSFQFFSRLIGSDFGGKMSCLKADRCCFCFSLRTGGLILGWIGLISSILGILRNLSRSQAYYEQLRKESQLLNVHLTPEHELTQNGTCNFNWILFSWILSCP